MLFSKDGLFPKIYLELDNQQISMARTFKFLGVTLDNELSFVHHYNQVHQKMTASYVLSTLSKNLPSECINTLYFAYFHLHLTYCMPIWFPLLSMVHQKYLISLQKRIVRLVGKVPLRAHCMPYFRKNRILRVTDQLTLDNGKLMFQIHNNLSPSPIINLFKNRNVIEGSNT